MICAAVGQSARLYDAGLAALAVAVAGEEGRVMRLDVLNRGYGPGTKLLFALIRLFSRHPVPDAAKLVFYRPDFYGSRAKEFTHEAMRGLPPGRWVTGS